MKKNISISLLALVAILTSCKKDYTNFESYSTSYQTVNDTLRITIKGSIGINELNGTVRNFESLNGLIPLDDIGAKDNTVTPIKDKTISYKIFTGRRQQTNLQFFKLDGSTTKIYFIKSKEVLNTSY